MSIDTCPLCRAVNNEHLVIGGVNVNKVLGRSGAFAIIPALGPLVIGHILIVSAKHNPGLRYLSSADQRDYESLSRCARNYCEQLGDTLLEAEHGARNTSLRGPCIRHAHVHILPGLGEVGKVFENNPVCDLIQDSNVSSVDSYIWVNDGFSVTTYDGSRVTGQEIRQTIGRYLKIDDWDWAVSPKPDLIARTIKYWRKISRWLH